MTALLLLTLLLYIPRVKWEEGEEGEPSRVLFATHSQGKSTTEKSVFALIRVAQSQFEIRQFSFLLT